LRSLDPEKIEENKYDLFLLCDIDLPWEADPQREHPHMREKLFTLYYDELKGRGVPFKSRQWSRKGKINECYWLVESVPGNNF